MSIKVGDTIPKAAINVIKDGIQATDTATFFAGKKVVLFALPGSFTPSCSAKHLPDRYITRLNSILLFASLIPSSSCFYFFFFFFSSFLFFFSFFFSFFLFFFFFFFLS